MTTPIRPSSGGINIQAGTPGEKLKKRKELTHILQEANVEVSNTSKAFRKVESFFNLGTSRSLNTDDLNPAEKEEFLSMLAALVKMGVVGYKNYEVNGRPEQHFIVTSMGNSRLYGKRVYDENGRPR